MFCRKCGKEMPAGSGFCAYCGAATPTEQDPSQTPQEQAPSPRADVTDPMPPGQPTPPAAQGKKSLLPWILGVLGVAALVAIVLVLVFVVFGGGNSEAADIEQVVNTYYESLERKDVDLYLSTWEPEKREEYDEEYAEDFLRFLPEDLDFEGMKYDIEIYGDEAEVQVIEGTASYIDPNTDEKVVEDAAFVDMEPLDLVKVDGKWYITSRFYEDG